MAKKKKKMQEKLETQIEDLRLEDMNTTEIEKVVKALSTEGMKLRAKRKKVRYQLYRLRTESEGKCSAECDEEFRKRFEEQPLFDNWRFFGTTWDVAFDDPYRIVHKDKSEQEEWNELVAAKFPSVDHEGRVHYPDIKVRKAVEKLAKERGLLKEDK